MVLNPLNVRIVVIVLEGRFKSTNPFSLELRGIDDCSSEGDNGLGSLCCGIILILLGIGVEISVCISIDWTVSGDKK